MNEGKVVGNESRKGEMQAEGESVSPLKPLCKSLASRGFSAEESHGLSYIKHLLACLMAPLNRCCD